MKKKMRDIFNLLAENRMHQAIALTLAVVVTFSTTYALVLPAVTLEKDIAETMAGINMSRNEQDEAPSASSETDDSNDGVSTGSDTETVAFDAEAKNEAGETETLVHVEADAGTFPQGTTMEATVVTDQDVIDSIAESAEGEVIAVHAVDLSFTDENGEPVQPAADSQVSVTLSAGEEIPSDSQDEDGAGNDASTDQNTETAVMQYTGKGGAEQIETNTDISFQVEPETDLDQDNAVSFDLSEQTVDQDAQTYAIVETISEETAAPEASDDADASTDETATEEPGVLPEGGSAAPVGAIEEYVDANLQIAQEVPADEAGEALLIAQDEGYLVTLMYSPEAMIPQGASLQVEELRQKEADYDTHLEETRKILREAAQAESGDDGIYAGPAAEESAFFGTRSLMADPEGFDRPQTGEAAPEIVYARFFDITILDADGNEIEPAAPVKVSIELLDTDQDEQVIRTADTAQVVHFGEETEMVEAEVIEDAAAGVAFDAAGFSVYGVVYTVDFFYSVDGQTYEAGIPGGGFVSFSRLAEALGILDPESEEEQEGTSDAEEDIDLNSIPVSEETRKFVANIETLTFSDPELVWVGKVSEESTVGALKEANKLNVEYSAELTEEQISELNSQTVEAGDWVLISLKAFDTEETLTVTMKNGDSFRILVTDYNFIPNAANKNQGANTLMDPGAYADVLGDGITIKLFDYTGTMKNGADIDKTWGSDTNNETAFRAGSGINKGRTLVFTGSGLPYNDNISWYNQFRGSKDGGNYYSGVLIPGIVDDRLVDGYPVLSDATKGWQTNDVRDHGSLGYLFGSGTQDGVESYTGTAGKGLSGLLQKDEDGYYYYSSECNYAQLNDSETQIDLYTDTYRKAASSSSDTRAKTEGIGFFPFTQYDSSKDEEKGPNAGGDYYNHQFGMSMNATFVYPTDGCLPNASGSPDPSKPMEFEFSGDDDVWVFIDGVLVLDLGGVHSPVRGNINFATGQVTVHPYDAAGTETDEVQMNNFFEKITSLTGKEFTPYSEHTIDFFYVERGGCDSNCSLSFNLLTKAADAENGHLAFHKVDPMDEPLEGAKFQLFTNSACTNALTWTVPDGDGFRTAVAISTADETGSVKFEAIPTGNYYMKEIEAPEGYAVSDRVYNVHIDAADGASWLRYDGQDVEEIVNHPLSLTLKKVDGSGHPLTGASFSLAYTSADGRETETTSIEITASNGEYALNSLKPGSYVLTETQAPGGYIGLAEAISFTVTESGVALGSHPDSVSYDGDALVLTIPNQPDVADGTIKAVKRWLDQNGNEISGGGRTAKVKLQRKCWTGSAASSKTISVRFVYPGYVQSGLGWRNNIAEEVYTGTVTTIGNSALIQWPYGGGDAGQTVTCDDPSVSLGKPYKGNGNDWNHIYLQVNDVTADCTVTITEKNTNQYWTKGGSNMNNNCFVNVSGAPVIEPELKDDTAFNASAEITELSYPTWSKAWTIGGTDAGYEGYDFPATDGTNPYQYYVIEVDEDGNEISVGEESNGAVLVGYSANNADGVSSQGVLTVYNQVEETTSDIKVRKLDETGSGLSGAVFQLIAVVGSEQHVYSETLSGLYADIKVDGEPLETIQIRTGADSAEIDCPSSFRTTGNEQTISGLPDGTYILREMEAPAGYVIEQKDIRFTVTHGEISDLTKSDKVEQAASDSLALLKITNTPGAVLPATGGIGTGLFTVLGTTLTAGAALLLWKRRSMI